MSKAVTNEEVEDVLSSIRRLVSEDKRPLAGLRSAPVEEVETPYASVEDEPSVLDDATPEANRLVLTPALRVLPAAQEEGADEGPLDLGSVARQTWIHNTAEDDAAKLEAAALPDDSGPMMLFPAAHAKPSDPAMDALDALVQDAIENEAKTIEDALHADENRDEVVEADGDIAATAEAGQSQGNDAQKLNDDMPDHEDNEKHGDQEAVDLQEGEHKDRTSDIFGEDAAQEAHPDQNFVSEVEPTFEDLPVSDDPTATLATPPPLTAPLKAKIAALEAALKGTHQEWEPDGDEADELALPDAPAMAWEDDVELDARGEPFVAPVDDVPETVTEAAPEPQEGSAAASLTADDQVLDEEALRDLVSEIVRAELQGALGERITRNVRKLVRREIHRALTAQEME